MHLTTEVIAVRDIQVGETVGYGSTWTASRPSTIATLAIGYADGYPRHAPTGTPVAVNGQRVPLVGRVSMDMITVDVTGIGPVSLGDPAELWGATISIDEVAQHVGTISYDLMTAITSRVPKHYS
jgi:alanine racemase